MSQRNSRGWTRTSDKTVNSRLLYQLSYAGSFCTKYSRQKYSTSEPGGVKDFACRVVGLKVTPYERAVVGATEGRLVGSALRPRGSTGRSGR